MIAMSLLNINVHIDIAIMIVEKMFDAIEGIN